MLPLYRPARLSAPARAVGAPAPGRESRRRSQAGPAAHHRPRDRVRSTVDGDLIDPGWQGVRRNHHSGSRPAWATTSSRRWGTSPTWRTTTTTSTPAFRFEDPNPTGIRAARRPRRGAVVHRLRRRHRRQPQRRQDRADVPRQPARRAVRRAQQRRHGRGQLAGLLLGRGRQDHRRPAGTLEIRVPFSSLRYTRHRPADLGHPALPQLPARPALPVLQRAAAARRQLLHLQLEQADRPRRACRTARTSWSAPFTTGIAATAPADDGLLGTPLEDERVRSRTSART